MNARVLASIFGSTLLLALSPIPTHAGGLVAIPFNIANFDHPLAITNRLLPLIPGTHLVYIEVEGGECNVNDSVVTNDAKTDFGGAYKGISARIVSDTVWADDDCDGGRDRLAELTSDYYAQDDAGNVWYLGEDTTAYLYDDAGQLIGTDKTGTWQSGVAGGQAGLIMLAHPAPGLFYRQEFGPGVAEDLGKVERGGLNVVLDIGTFDGCLLTKESTPLAPGDIERKTYCPDIGVVLVDIKGNKGMAELVDFGP